MIYFNILCEDLLALDRELKTIRGSLRSEISRKVETENHISREKAKLQEMESDSELYTDEQRQEVRDRMKMLNDDLTARKEAIDVLKGKLKIQITSIRETITKVFDSDTSSWEKVKAIYREQACNGCFSFNSIWGGHRISF